MRTQSSLVILLLMGIGSQLPVQGMEPKRVAILVGINKYEDDGFEALQCAEIDASELARELRRHRFDVALLTGSAIGPNQATLKNIEHQIQTQLKDVANGDIVVIGLFGHGRTFPGSEFEGHRLRECFCPVDAKASDQKTMLHLQSLSWNVPGMRESHNIVFVDACRKVPKTPDLQSSGIGGRIISQFPGNTAVFYSCRAGQNSFEDPDSLRHGTFAHALLKSLHDSKAGEDSLKWFDLVSRVADNFNSVEVELAIPQESIQEPILFGHINDFVFSAGKSKEQTTDASLEPIRDFTGIWEGKLEGFPSPDDRPVPFTSVILQQGNLISGLILEDNRFESPKFPRILSSIEGRVLTNGEIEFKKTFEGIAKDQLELTFRGTSKNLKAGVSFVKGTWVSGSSNGTFSLERNWSVDVKSATGLWYGCYFYPEGGNQSPVDFQLFAVEKDNRIAGYIKEANTFGSNDTAWLFAHVEGKIDDNSKVVTFKKTYDGTGGSKHDVEYSCRLSDNGLQMTEGRWVLGGNFAGKFMLQKCVP